MSGRNFPWKQPSTAGAYSGVPVSGGRAALLWPDRNPGPGLESRPSGTRRGVSVDPFVRTDMRNLSGAVRHLTEDERDELLQTFERTAFRLELQPAYAVDHEQQTIARFLAGNPEPPTATPILRAWLNQVAQQVRDGKRIERVRVHDDPPTPYQRWVQWASKWSTSAGETISYMTRQDAQASGLLGAEGSGDWWLLDSRLLVVMQFGPDGRRRSIQLVDDPVRVQQACASWKLAIRHSSIGHAMSRAGELTWTQAQRAG